eukprot:sb/3469775/
MCRRIVQFSAFFVAYLHDPKTIPSLPPITDEDPPLTCEIMDGRDAFLTRAKDLRLEFSSLRRAKFSTLHLLCDLHTRDKFMYSCNNCAKNVETRWHCPECTDFDLCIPCYEKQGHVHTMTKLGLGIMIDTPTTKQEGGTNPVDAPRLRKESIQRCIQSLVHACSCFEEECHLPSCAKMKKVVLHTRGCKKKTDGGYWIPDILLGVFMGCFGFIGIWWLPDL